MIDILFWVGVSTGGFLLGLMLLSLVLGHDFDFHLDLDTDVDSEGFGFFKSLLAFVSVGTLTTRAILLNSTWSWSIAVGFGVVAGIVAIFLLAKFLQLLLLQQEDGTIQLWETKGKVGTVYVPIQKDGIGRINVTVKNSNLELQAKSDTGEAIGTGHKVLIVDTEETCVIVSLLRDNEL